MKGLTAKRIDKRGVSLLSDDQADQKRLQLQAMKINLDSNNDITEHSDDDGAESQKVEPDKD